MVSATFAYPELFGNVRVVSAFARKPERRMEFLLSCCRRRQRNVTKKMANANAMKPSEAPTITPVLARELRP